MPRVVIDPAVPDRESPDNEIARLRGLDIEGLRARWHTLFRRRAPPHLPRHLVFRILAYRLQADRLGELDADTRRLLDRIGSGASDETDRLAAVTVGQVRAEMKPCRKPSNCPTNAGAGPAARKWKRPAMTSGKATRLN
jgi:Protein of unknown function (DUF2924)